MRPIRTEHGLVMMLGGSLTAMWVLGERSGQQMQIAAELQSVPLSGGATVGLIVLLIFLNGLFVAGETAVDLLRAIHVRHVKEDPRQSQRLQDLLEGKQKYTTACALGSRTVWLVLGLLVLLLALGYGIQARSSETAVFDIERFFVNLVLTALPVVLINLIVGDLVPKSYASLHPHGTALRLYRVIRSAAVVFSIPANVLVAVANLVTRFFGGRASFTLPNQAEEEIRTLVESAQETGEIEVDEKELLDSVFEFTDTVAREVMTPRVDVDSMPVRSDPQELVRVMRESGHSRIPLYEETDDQIVGIIHAKDLLMAMVQDGPPPSVRPLMRPALFVPEGKNLHELLTEMRASRSQMAVVQDEFGGTAGIVTIEDIVEELVGEIVDEYDVEEPEVVEEAGSFLVEGKTHLDDVNDQVGSDLDSEEFDTIGGYVFGLFGRQPKKDESIIADGYRFSVVDTDGKRVLKLRIHALTPQELESAQQSDYS